MTHYTIEHKVDSMRGGWRKPIYSGKRSYYNKTQVNKRIRWLRNEYGDENVSHMPCTSDPMTTIVYIRIN